MKILKRLFKGKPQSAAQKTNTIPIPKEQISDETQKRIIFTPAQLLVGCAQSIGKQREHNEDTCYILHSILSNKEGNIPLGLFIIADGMGGHQFGDIASDVATRAVVNKVGREILSIQRGSGQKQKSIQRILEDSVLEAHHDVLSKAPGGGTTLSVLFCIGNRFFLFKKR